MVTEVLHFIPLNPPIFFFFFLTTNYKRRKTTSFPFFSVQNPNFQTKLQLKRWTRLRVGVLEQLCSVTRQEKGKGKGWWWARRERIIGELGVPRLQKTKEWKGKAVWEFGCFWCLLPSHSCSILEVVKGKGSLFFCFLLLKCTSPSCAGEYLSRHTSWVTLYHKLFIIAICWFFFCLFKYIFSFNCI